MPGNDSSLLTDTQRRPLGDIIEHMPRCVARAAAWCCLAAILAPAAALRVRWNDLPQRFHKRTIAVVLTSGQRLEGHIESVTPRALIIVVSREDRTRPPYRVPRVIGREWIAYLETVRSRHGRMAGLAAGAAAGLPLGAVAAAGAATGAASLGGLADLSGDPILIDP